MPSDETTEASSTPNPNPTVDDARARVLVVDDEPAVGRAIRRMLMPYDVTLVDGGAAALALLERDPSFDAIVCDVSMPEVSGLDVYESLARMNPDLARRFVFVSGGAFDVRTRDLLEKCGVTVVDKPCIPTELRDVVASRVKQ